MSEYRTILERDIERVAPPDFGLQQLQRRRDRLDRNRRIRAGAVGIIVALATAAVLVRSIGSERVPAHPPVPPPAAAGTLAYVLDGDVYVADPDGSNAVKIADGRGDDKCDGGNGESYSAEGSMWSPDGRYLAYRSTDCSDPTSWGGAVISDAEGNVLATFPREGWQIAWSPDSTRVAVWDVTFETIGVYGLDGARQAQLTMPPTWSYSGDHDPEWMPDGASVWVDNVVLPLDGSTPRFVSHGGDPYATYSPDGSLVAYSRGVLMVARSDGSEPRKVFDQGVLADDWGYAWSATGDQIAFATGIRGSAAFMEVGVVDVATGSVTLLAEGERGAGLRAIGFSPTGDRILFSSRLGNASRTFESSLWSVGVDGSDARLVVDGTIDGEWLSR
jgi:Tol biopolymer transport system component